MVEAFPVAALDDRLGIVGTTGSGKTYTALVLAEKLLAAGRRVVLVDPLGVTWGLRLDATGKKPSGFKIPIFGGAHGDLPLVEHAGALIGETVAGMAESCIVDLSQFSSAAAERRFVLAFLQRLYRLHSGSPIHLILDEADMWAPQQIMEREGDATTLKGHLHTVIRRGRVKGFVPWLITQRPAVIDKSVLAMMDGLVSMRLTAPQDRDALGAWIKGQVDAPADLLAEVPRFKTGEALAFLPRHGGVSRITVPQRITFDSSAAPKQGDAAQAVKLEPLDIDAVRDRLKAVETEIKASDPKHLRSEIAKLTQQIATSAAMSKVADLARVKAEGYAEGYRDGALEGRAEAMATAYSAALAELRPVMARLEELAYGEALGSEPSNVVELDKARPKPAPKRDITGALAAQGIAEKWPTPAPESTVRGPAGPQPIQPQQPFTTGPGTLSSGAAKIVAQLEKVWPMGLTLLKAAEYGGVGTRSSQFPAYKKEIAALVEAGQLERDGDKLRAMRQVGSPRDIVDGYRAQWPPSYTAMFDAIASNGAEGVSREIIVDRAGISPTSSTVGAGLKALVDSGLVEKAGALYVLAEAFR